MTRAAEGLRTSLTAACTWSVRDDASARAALAAIAEGDGVADLCQDLSDLAELVESKAAMFSADATFDPIAAAEAARSLSSLVAERLAVDRNAPAQQPARAGFLFG